MSAAMEDVARAAAQLSKPQRLALDRYLLDLDSAGAADTVEVDRAWDAEICDRIRAVDEGRSEALPDEEVLARVDRRLGP